MGCTNASRFREIAAKSIVDRPGILRGRRLHLQTCRITNIPLQQSFLSADGFSNDILGAAGRELIGVNRFILHFAISFSL
jgi:hypothetical protein